VAVFVTGRGSRSDTLQAIGMLVDREKSGVRVAAALLVTTAVALAVASAASASVRARVPALAGAVVVQHPSNSIAGPSRARGATIAGIVLATESRSRPGGGHKVWRVEPQTSWSSEPQVLLVMGSTIHDGREWVRVLLPIRPDHTTAWVPRDNVVLLHTPYWVTVDKHARAVTVYRDGSQLHRYRAVIGKAATPTPDGLAAIWEKDPQPDPTAFLGPWALPLTVLSHVLHNFGGGPGRVAIHGRDAASLENPLGSAASHGCVRIDNAPITWMAHHLPQGTPVQINP
jgi:lipoprotein-anchoring transpeptidase ErfK/SrfK